jgi:hypothetical protein
MIGLNGSSSLTLQPNSLFQRFNWEEIWEPPLTLILNKNGSVMYRTYVRPLAPDENQYLNEKKEREEFDIAIKKKFCAPMDKSDFKDDPDYADFVTPNYDCYEDDEFTPSKMPGIDDVNNEDDVDTYDQYVGAHVRVPIGDEIRAGKVVRHKRELDGNMRG